MALAGTPFQVEADPPAAHSLRTVRPQPPPDFADEAGSGGGSIALLGPVARPDTTATTHVLHRLYRVVAGHSRLVDRRNAHSSR
jgi:hypothetical protein